MRTEFYQQVRITYLSKLIENLKDEFSTMNLISCFSVFNSSELLQTESELLHTEIDILLKHYSESPLAVNFKSGQL